MSLGGTGERNVSGKFATSESWHDGSLISTAEAIALRRAKLPADVKAAVNTQSGAGYDAAHWRWQPVGGRTAYPMPQKAPGDHNARGTLMSKANQSSVDLIVFGHEQDGVGAGEEGLADDLGFDDIGKKKKIPGLHGNNSQLDGLVFGTDTDGFSDIRQLEKKLATLPQFNRAAGAMSSQVEGNKLEPEVKESKFAKLKNAGSVDEARDRRHRPRRPSRPRPRPHLAARHRWSSAGTWTARAAWTSTATATWTTRRSSWRTTPSSRAPPAWPPPSPTGTPRWPSASCRRTTGARHLPRAWAWRPPSTSSIWQARAAARRRRDGDAPARELDRPVVPDGGRAGRARGCGALASL
jgi:hypothetical protein